MRQKIFIIESAGKPVGALRIDKEQTSLLIDGQFYEPVNPTITKRTAVAAAGADDLEIEDGAAAYVRNALINPFGPVQFGIGIDLEANDRQENH